MSNAIFLLLTPLLLCDISAKDVIAERISGELAAVEGSVSGTIEVNEWFRANRTLEPPEHSHCQFEYAWHHGKWAVQLTWDDGQKTLLQSDGTTAETAVELWHLASKPDSRIDDEGHQYRKQTWPQVVLETALTPLTEGRAVDMKMYDFLYDIRTCEDVEGEHCVSLKAKMGLPINYILDLKDTHEGWEIQHLNLTFVPPTPPELEEKQVGIWANYAFEYNGLRVGELPIPVTCVASKAKDPQVNYWTLRIHQVNVESSLLQDLRQLQIIRRGPVRLEPTVIDRINSAMEWIVGFF